MANAATELLQEVKFNGDTNASHQSGYLNATDYLLSVRNRKAKNQWDDARTIANAVASMTGLAATWWHTTVPDVYSRHADAIKTDLNTFVKFYSDRFHIDDRARTAKLVDLQIQRGGETPSAFTDRIVGALSGFRYASEVPIPVNGTPDDLDDLTAQQKVRMATHVDREVTAGARLTFQRTMAAMAKALVVEGLTVKIVKDDAWKSVDKSLEDFVGAIHDAERMCVKNGHASNGKAQKKYHKVHEVADDDEAEDYEADEVNKVNAKSKGKGKSSKPKKKVICDYCKIPGHTKAECRKKKKAEQTATSATESTLVSGVSNTMVSGVSTPTASGSNGPYWTGNAAGLW